MPGLLVGREPVETSIVLVLGEVGLISSFMTIRCASLGKPPNPGVSFSPDEDIRLPDFRVSS